MLEASDVVTLQHVNRRFLSLGRDDTLWREQCFKNSSFLSNLRRRRELISSDDEQDPRFRDLARALATGNGLGDSRLAQPREEARDLKAQSNERIRILANWDPSYPKEKVDWYDEYIARNAPISTSWLQQPRNRDSNEREYLEVRGMGIYTPPGESDATMVVAPLDDGSVCLWSLTGEPGRKGSIVARSKSGLISVDPAPHRGEGRRSKMISTGVTECVSVDSAGKRAYFAVQSGMFNLFPGCLLPLQHKTYLPSHWCGFGMAASRDSRGSLQDTSVPSVTETRHSFPIFCFDCNLCLLETPSGRCCVQHLFKFLFISGSFLASHFIF